MGAGVGIYLDRGWNQTPSIETRPFSPSASQGRVVHALGLIQPSGGVIEVAVPAGLRALRFAERTKVGNPVKAGEPLAYLDGYDERLCEVNVIDQEIKAAEQNRQSENDHEQSALFDIDRELSKTIRLGQMQLESSELKIKCLEQKYGLARKQLEDVEGLQLNNTISRQQYEQLKVQAEISLDELLYAKSERERAQKELDLRRALRRSSGRSARCVSRQSGRGPSYPSTRCAPRGLAEAGKNRCTCGRPGRRDSAGDYDS